MPSPDYLECSHCGDAAVESDDGLFSEDDADRCQTCGMPGRVSVDGGEDGLVACWITDDSQPCTRPDCEECAETRKALTFRRVEVPHA